MTAKKFEERTQQLIAEIVAHRAIAAIHDALQAAYVEGLKDGQHNYVDMIALPPREEFRRAAMAEGLPYAQSGLDFLYNYIAEYVGPKGEKK